MRLLSTFAIIGIAGIAGAQTLLHDNGGMVTHPGAGPGGRDVSMAESIGGVSTAGSNVLAQAGVHFRIADDFVVTGPGWIVANVRVHAYQTGAATPTWTGAELNIWNAEPAAEGAQMVFTQSYTAGQLNITNTGINRIFNGAANLTNQDRQVNSLTMSTGNLVLNPGTYWIDWRIVGGASAWAPYVMVANPVEPNSPTTVFDNGRQMFNAAGDWQPLLQAPGAETPFHVYGEVVPEPTTMLALAAGVGLLARRRRKAQS
jgi:hypothetical protein